MPARREGEPVDREGITNFRRRRRRTASVEGVKRCVSKSGCCATPPVSESCRHHHPTGSPFGHHPRLRIVCPLRGQWVDNEFFFSYQEIKLFGGVCFLLVAALFVALKNTIRASADAIRMSADSLIVFSDAIRIFAERVDSACSSSSGVFQKCLEL